MSGSSSPGADRGTISSSLILVGEAITMDHILGDPRDRGYQGFRLPEESSIDMHIWIIQESTL